VADTYKVVITFPYVGAASASDVSVNTWFFNWLGVGEPAGADWDHLLEVMQPFYNAVHSPGINRLAYYMSTRLNRDAGAVLFESYKLPPTPGPTGPPVYSSPMTLAAPGSTTAANLPNQLAVCLSYFSDMTGISEHTGTTRPRSRHRGRVFLGPWSSLALAGVLSGGVEHIAPALIQGVQGAGEFLGGAVDAVGFHWAQFSRVDWVGRRVIGGWCDDRWDVQRRRAEEVATKTIFVTGP
jgi:hypothetical protein